MDDSKDDWGVDDVRQNAEIIEIIFATYGIRAIVMQINVKSKSMQYCIEVDKVSRIDFIKNLDKELALALSSPTGKIKIQAPVPNTNFIGIDLPKRKKPLEKRAFNVVTANDKVVKIKDLNLLVSKFPKRRLNELVNEALNFIYRNKFDVVGIILLQEELKIKPKEAIVVFKELVNMDIILNPRSEEGKPGVAIGNVDWNSLKEYTIN